MSDTMELIITIVGTILASSGFWLFIQRKLDKNDGNTKMLLGLAHDRLMYLGMHYVNRKDENGESWITRDEYENFNTYLYGPYEKIGGDGSVKRVKFEVDKLPLRDGPYMTK